MTLVRGAERWVFAAQDARRLAAVRIGLCGVLAVRLAVTGYDPAADRMNRFQPHFYMHLFGHVPPDGVIAALQIGGVACAAAAAAGLAFRATLPAALLCALVLDGTMNSTGRIIVGDAVLMLCLLLLAASGRAPAEAWSVRRDGPRPRAGERYGWPIRAAMVVIALAYFFSGIQKWRYSGLPWVTSDNLRWILYASSDARPHPNEFALFVADRPLLAHLLAGGALLLETCFPLVLFFPRLRLPFVAGALAMHAGVRLALGIDYSTQALTLLVVFVDWSVVSVWIARVFTVPRTQPG